ncbi:hypothetical protein ACFVDH_37145 [Streptomyces sp. NPDC057674]|uniref:hypothetical protein n=1 Tax=Streptomyces sp. NPDC057674 TaxID=3346203 RepID=UPI0036908115
MITAMAAVGYILVGLIAARVFVVVLVKTNQYDSSWNREEANLAIAATLFVWPVWIPIGLFITGWKLLTRRLPKSPRELEREEQELSDRIRKLERELRP